jgi:serine/threonine protein kinase
MAPEVHHGAKAAGPAADVFAFGLIAREILGVLNRSSEVSVGMAMAAGISPEMPPVGDCFPDLDPDLARMLDDCLLLDPGSRPSAERLAEALRWPFRAGQQATG